MIYEYACENCQTTVEIFKPMREYARPEPCSKCKTTMTKLLSAGYFLGEKVEDHFYSPALGKVVSSRKEQSTLAKQMGYEEVGNEDQDKHIKPPESTYEV